MSFLGDTLGLLDQCRIHQRRSASLSKLFADFEAIYPLVHGFDLPSTA